MIINRDESEVAVLGEVQKYKVSIDEKNLQHIITILSSNLYSHPMQSFLREIVSNAVDSHIEAGVDEPIIITITDNDLSIRDFGTGISPERFRDVFINIGSSTKRDSNGFIGYFGIGKYASLAVADIVNITSFYEGKAYYYVMNKDIDQLHIDLLFEKDTNEHNGVEVKIPFKEKLFTEDWRTLSFIKNIYVEDERKNAYGDQCAIVTSFNKRKVYSYKSFKVLNIEYPFKSSEDYTRVLIGSIPYRVDYSSLWSDDTHDVWAATFKRVCPCLNIGDVDITPNREGLLYSERTKNALRGAYTNAIIELTELWNASCNEEYTDFKAFACAIKNHYTNCLYLDGLTIELPEELPYKALYKGFEDCDFKVLKDIILKLFCHKYEDVVVRYEGYRNEMQKGKSALYYDIEDLLNSCTRSSEVVVAVPDAQGFSSKYIKGFLSEQFGNKTVIIVKKPRLTKYTIRHFIREKFGITTLANSKNVHLIMKLLREFIQWFNQHVKDCDIIHSEEYLQYKEDNKEEKVYVRSHTKIPYHIWYPSQSGYITESDTPDDLMIRLKRKYKNCRIVYAQLENIFINAFKDIGYPNLIIIGLSQSNYQLAEKGMFPSWVTPIESLYSEDNRTLQKMAALEYIRSKLLISEITIPLPKHIRKLSKDLLDWSERYPHYSRNYSYDGCSSYALLDIVPIEKYDYQIMALYHQVEKYIRMDTKLNQNRMSGQPFYWYFLMKAKKIRLDYDFYKNIKDNINYIMNSI